jgi:6,7-dimethyl-8-ribityllumazine synthase
MMDSMKSNTADFKIAMVAAKWHSDLVNIATSSCHDELVKLGISKKNIELIHVPGSLELPLMSKLLASSNDWDAVIVFGLVVDGGIYRHDFVAQAVIDGIVSVGLETSVPVLSAVLSPQHFDEQDNKHMAFLQKHLVGKGVEVADSTLEIIQLTRPLRRK